ncbi:hypothetical protein Roomu2_00090 [Pseudomonas phage vB_PpuM-Roomu-2]|uniref:Uncharacterized protein n=1 Tax=Pseudomonas phage vB_PpuM-Roomu-2 TaxID=3132621 RepID=A0AAX4MZW2_9CAUD
MIKIESQIWSVVNQNRRPLAYMCQVTQKKDGTPDSATQKKMETGRKWARNPKYQPMHYVDGEWVKNGPVVPANEGIEAFHDNVPMKGFIVAGEAGRWTTEATYIEIIDPRGFKVQVPVGNLTTLMRSCDIIKGVIQEECVWGREDQHILLPVHSKEYKDAVGQIERVEEALKLKDLVPGDWVKLHQYGEEGLEKQFLGMVKLEWTQHRTLYDLERDRGFSYLYCTKRVNERDDGSETLRDTQWVGLFAEDIVTTQIEDGFYHCGRQPKYKYGPTEPGVRIENSSVKITSRRSGEVPEVYAGLDGLNLALDKVIYYNDGRSDCPERVMKRFEKQKYENRYNREAVKDVIDTSYSATVYLQA